MVTTAIFDSRFDKLRSRKKQGFRAIDCHVSDDPLWKMRCRTWDYGPFRKSSDRKKGTLPLLVPNESFIIDGKVIKRRCLSMPLPLINTVISTNQAGLLSNTFSQLNALQRERHTLLNHIQALQGQTSSNTRADAMNRIQEDIISVEQQMRNLQQGSGQSFDTRVHQNNPADQLTVSREAVQLYQNNQ